MALGLVAVGLAGPADAKPLQPNTGLKPFTYTNSPDALPNYVPGAKWGTQTDPIRTMQLPLSPEESMAHLVLPPGFESLPPSGLAALLEYLASGPHEQPQK